jgi:hypothetical protein
MNEFTKKAAAALELLPEEMQEHAVSYLLEQAEKFRALKADIDKAAESVESGHVREWDFADFLRRARLPSER